MNDAENREQNVLSRHPLGERKREMLHYFDRKFLSYNSEIPINANGTTRGTASGSSWRFLCKQSSDNLIRHFAIGIARGIPRSLFIEHCFQNDFHDNVHCERILSNDYDAEQEHLFKQFKEIAYDYRASILIKSEYLNTLRLKNFYRKNCFRA